MITRHRLAKSITVPQRRVDEIYAGKRAITVDTALRLGRFFGTDAQSWMNLQAEYDLECGAIALKDRIMPEVKQLKDAARKFGGDKYNKNARRWNYLRAFSWGYMVWRCINSAGLARISKWGDFK